MINKYLNAAIYEYTPEFVILKTQYDRGNEKYPAAVFDYNTLKSDINNFKDELFVSKTKVCIICPKHR